MEVFQCLPMSEVNGGVPMFAYVLGEGGQGGDKMCWYVLFFFAFFFSNAEFMDEVKFLCFLYWNAFFCAELLYHKTVQ